MFNRLWWLVVAAALSADAAEKVFDFSETAEGKTPAGFRSLRAGQGAPGEWQIVMDEVPPLLAPLTDKAPSVTRRAVLAQVNQDPADERFPMLVLDGESFSDFTLTTRFKAVRGGLEQMAGIAFRIQNEKNFYVIRASALGNNVRFYKVVDGVRGNPIGPEQPVTKGVWHELKIECKANQISSWLDGHVAIPTLTDNTFTAGKIGFWTKSDSLSYFADTKILYTPRVPLAQTVVQELVKKNPRLIDLKIYARGADGEPRVIGSKNEKEIGLAGGKVEKDCIATGQLYSGKQKTHMSLVMPLRDRDGETIAAVRFALDTFLGQTDDNALARARPLVKQIQARVQTADDLSK
jgi:hypothetical protein